MDIYIIRHGQTVWNESKRLQGSRDISLNENGKQLAKERSEELKDIKWDIVFSSPLKRAYETASIIRGERQIPIIKDDRLKEVNFGINEGKSAEEMRADKNNPFYNFFDNPAEYKAPEGGEELDSVCKRTKEFLQEEIEPNINKWDKVLIAGHGAMNKGMMCYILDHGIDEYWSGGLQKNCGILIVRLDDNGYKLIGEL